jgi:hypothetical protein
VTKKEKKKKKKKRKKLTRVDRDGHAIAQPM